MARPALKKGAIEEAAIELFATRGIAATTIRDIAELAGVTEGALYRHYPGKNEMAARLFSREVERFSQGLRDVLFDAEADFEARVRRAVAFIYAYYRDYPMHFSFILMAQHGFPGRRLLEERFNPNDMVIEFVRREMAAGAIPRRDAVLTAALIMGAVMQPVVMHWNARVSVKPVEVAGEVAAACMRIIGPDGSREVGGG